MPNCHRTPDLRVDIVKSAERRLRHPINGPAQGDPEGSVVDIVKSAERRLRRLDRLGGLLFSSLSISSNQPKGD